jgi:lipoprotein-releasing system permease protein
MINIITGVSVFGLAFGTAALLIILSVFNGLEGLILGMQSQMDPEIEIYPTSGKTFELDTALLNDIRSWPEVAAASLTLEELAMMEYNKIQTVAVMKGVENTYGDVTNIDSVIRKGDFILEENEIKYAVLPLGLSYDLRINLYDQFTPLTVYALKRNQVSSLSKPYNSAVLYPSGVYASVQDEDYPVMLAPLIFVEQMLDSKGKYSSLEIKLKAGVDQQSYIKKLSRALPDGVGIKTLEHQNASTQKIIRLEKWLAFAILCLAIILVALNLIGTLWMIVIDKKRDIAVLKSLGATDKLIQRVFINLGLLITLAGLVLGLAMAGTLYGLQKAYGIIPIPEGYVVDAYPMIIRWLDIPAVAGAVFLIAVIAILFPARRSAFVSVQIREE